MRKDLDRLIALKAYLESEGLSKEAGFVGDIIETAKSSASGFWNRNKAMLAKAALLIALGVVARDYFEEDSATRSAAEMVDQIFEKLTKEDYITYEIVEGDTLWSIARNHYPEISAEEGIQIILDENNIENADSIFPGQIIKIPNSAALIEIAEEEPDEHESSDGRINIDDLEFSLAAEERLKIAEGARDGSGDHLEELYRDGVGKWTIGWGHNASAQRDVSRFRGRTISGAEAQAVLDEDLEVAEGGVKRWLRERSPNAELMQFEYDTLVSLAFNGGVGSQSIVKRVIFSSNIDQGDYSSVATAIGGFGDPSGNNAGLHARRISEIISWRGGDVTEKEVSAIVEAHGWKISRRYRSRSISLRNAVKNNSEIVDSEAFENFIRNNREFCGTACSG